MSIVVVVGRSEGNRGLPQNPTADPDIYLPFADRNAQVGLALRASVPPASLIATVRAAVRAVDPSIPLYGHRDDGQLGEHQTSQSRFTMWLMGVFAAVALSTWRSSASTG